MTTEQNTATVLLYADVDVEHWNANGGLDGADSTRAGYVRKGDYASSYMARLKESLFSTESAEAPCYKEDLCRIVFRMASVDPEGPLDFADETHFLPKVVTNNPRRIHASLFHRSADEPSFKDRMVRMVLGRDLVLSRVKGNEVFALIHKNSKGTLQSVRVFMRVPEAEAGLAVLAAFNRWDSVPLFDFGDDRDEGEAINRSWRNAKRGHELNLYRGISAEAHKAARKVAEMLAPFMAYASAKETVSNQQHRISRQESQAVSVDRKWEEHNAKAASLFTRLTDRGMSEVEDAEAFLAEAGEGRLERLLGVDVENAKRNLAFARSMLTENPELVLCPGRAPTGASWLFHAWEQPERWFRHIAEVAKQYSEAIDIINRAEAGNHGWVRPADAERAEIAEAQAIIDSIDLDALLSPVLKASEEAREVTAERVDLKTFRDAVATFINESPREDLDAFIEDSGLLHGDFTAPDLILEPTDAAHEFSSARVELTAAGEAKVTVPVLLKSRYSSVERTFGSGEVTLILPKVTATRSRNPDGRFTCTDAMFFAYGREWVMPENRRWSSSRPEGFKAEVTYDLQAVEEAQEVAA